MQTSAEGVQTESELVGYLAIARGVNCLMLFKWRQRQ